MKVYKAIDDDGLNLRVRNSITDEGVFAKDTGSDFERVLNTRSQYEAERISTGSIKMFVDGVLEGETASLVEPYRELGHTGFLNYSKEDLFSRVARYEAMGLQIHMHTMGDGAARAGLDAIEYAREQNKDNPKSQDLRHHLSHLQLVHPEDIDRFAKLNVADAIDLETALKAYTVNAACLMHQEDSVSSIEVGKRADLVVLDRNLFAIPSTQISEAKVLFTIFDGQIVYRAANEH